MPCQPCPDFRLWTGGHLGSVLVWAKFNLSHATEHRSGLYSAEGSRWLLTFTRVTWALARQNWPELHELLLTQMLNQTLVDLGWTSAVILRREAKSSTLLSKFRTLFLGLLRKVQGAGFVRGKWF